MLNVVAPFHTHLIPNVNCLSHRALDLIKKNVDNERPSLVINFTKNLFIKLARTGEKNIKVRSIHLILARDNEKKMR